MRPSLLSLCLQLSSATCLAVLLAFIPCAAPRVVAEEPPAEGRLTEETIAAFRAMVEKDPRTPALVNALTRNSIKDLVIDHQKVRGHDANYTLDDQSDDIPAKIYPKF